MKALAENKRARSDYHILKTYEAGISLLGHEVKSAKSGRISLKGSYAQIRGGEAWLIGADIQPYQPKNIPASYDAKRTRQLLLTKKEIKELTGKMQEGGLTLVPLRVYSKRRLVKLELGLGRHKRKADKRETIKKRESERDIRRALKK